MNVIYSHDSLDIAGRGFYKIQLGRWLYPLLVRARSLPVPWLMGTLSTVYVSLAAVLAAKVLELSKRQGLCMGILFAANITLTSLFGTFIFDADADCLALLLACFLCLCLQNVSKIHKYGSGRGLSCSVHGPVSDIHMPCRRPLHSSADPGRGQVCVPQGCFNSDCRGSPGAGCPRGILCPVSSEHVCGGPFFGSFSLWNPTGPGS